jgi:hypothetical protein
MYIITILYKMEQLMTNNYFNLNTSYIVQLLVICAESFFVNTYIAIKSIILILGNSSYMMDMSLQNYNNIIEIEIEKQQNQHVTYYGVIISTIFCMHTLYVIIINLLFPIITHTIWWLFCWCFLYSVKEIGISGLAKFKIE